MQCRGVQAWYGSRDLKSGDTGSVAEGHGCERAWKGAWVDPRHLWGCAQPASGQLKRCGPGSWAKMGLGVTELNGPMCVGTHPIR